MSESKPISAPDAPAWLVPAAIVAVLVSAWIQYQCWPFVTDDAYITLRYAARLAAGQGLTFNTGEWVEGYSNPLWTIWLALSARMLPFDLVDLARGWGLLFCCATVALVPALLRQLTSASRAMAAGALLLILAQPGVQVYASLGMEVPQLAFLLSLGVYSSLRVRTASLAWYLLAAFCFSLVGISRPEGPLYALLWGVTLAVILLRQRGWSALLPLSALGLVTVLPALLWQYYRLQVYGAWVPNTAIVKASGSGIAAHSELLGVIWLPLLAVLALALLYWVKPAVLSVVRPLWRRSLLLLAPVLAGLIFVLFAGPDWMAFMRFLQPVLPLMITLSVAVLFELARQAPDRLRARLFSLIVMTSIIIPALTAIPFGTGRSFASMLMRNEAPTYVAQWLQQNYPGPHTLAAARIGAVSYFNPQYVVWDFFGLTDQAQAQAVLASGMPAAIFANQIAGNPILVRQPELVLIIRPPWKVPPAVYAPEELQTLTQHWRCVRQFKQERWGTYDLWVRRDLPVGAVACDGIGQ